MDTWWMLAFSFCLWPAEAYIQVVRSFIRYQSYEHDILKANEPLSMIIGTSGPWGNGVKRSTFGVRKSKTKVAWCQNRSQKSLSARFLKNYPTNFSQTWQSCITVNVHCVTATRRSKVRLTRGQRCIWRYYRGTVLDPLGPVAFLFQKCTYYESAASFLHCRSINV